MYLNFLVDLLFKMCLMFLVIFLFCCIVICVVVGNGCFFLVGINVE